MLESYRECILTDSEVYQTGNFIDAHGFESGYRFQTAIHCSNE